MYSEEYLVPSLFAHPIPINTTSHVSLPSPTLQNPIQKLVAVRDVHPSDDAAMVLQKGEIIYVASRWATGQKCLSSLQLLCTVRTLDHSYAYHVPYRPIF